MPTYKVQQTATAYGWIEIKADSEQQAIEIAMNDSFADWKYDTDWDNAEDPQIVEVSN